MKHLEPEKGVAMARAMAESVFRVVREAVRQRLGEPAACCEAQVLATCAAEIIILARRAYPEMDAETWQMFKTAIGIFEAAEGIEAKPKGGLAEALQEAVGQVANERGVKIEIVALMGGKEDRN